jgi:hypothetical protein
VTLSVRSAGSAGVDLRAGEARPPVVTPAPRGRLLGVLAAVGIPLVIGVLHVIVVARHYHVGSFDDDASYILTAKAILAGHGLTGRLATGAVVVGLYPPGYAALLAPLVWVFGQADLVLRALSVLCYAALFPLTWCYLARRRLPTPVRVAVLVLMALNPVLATFGSMVMAETPFLVLFLVSLLLLERWERSNRLLPAVGVGAIVSIAGLVWLKEAGAAMVAGAAVWLLLRRETRKAVALAGGSLLLLSPVVVARLVAGVPVTGARYSEELGLYYSGTLASRAEHIFGSIGHYLSTALPASLVPVGAPLPVVGWRHEALAVLAWHVPVLCLMGLVVWIRRYRDAAVLMVLFYIVETLFWPLINERRVVLVLPIVLAWYVVGWWSVGASLLRWAGRTNREWRTSLRSGAVVLVAVVIVAPLVAQFSRDYLFDAHQDSSRPEGSRYAAILSASGRPGDVVETSYLSTVALVSGHRTADSAFLSSLGLCYEPANLNALAKDDAAYLLTGALNKPELVDGPCLLSEASSGPWAVRLMRTDRDLASVFELIGPGTAHQNLTDVTATATLSGSSPLVLLPVAPGGAGDLPGTLPATLATGGAGALTWDWSRPAMVRQVSVGEAGAAVGTVDGVSIELRQPSGSWVAVAGTGSGVGDLPDDAPFLMAALPGGMVATALRVVIGGSGQVSALDVHALADSGAP